MSNQRPMITHINCWAAADERQHVLAASCWCEPAVTEFTAHAKSKVAHTVLDHSGATRPSVRYVPSFADSYQPPRGVRHRTGGWSSVRGDSL